jgi:hypothetical protein
MSEAIASTDGGQGASAAPAATGAAVSTATAPAAPTGTQATAAPAPAAPAAAPSWLNGADETTIGYVQNKGWNDPKQVLDGYRNLEKLLGADKANNAVVLPKHDADPKEWGAVYDKLGRPSTPEGYQVQFPDGGDKNAQASLLAKVHELGLTKSQAEGLFGELNNRVTTQQNAAKADAQTRFQAEDQAIRAEWGQAYQQNLVQAQAAARGLGLDAPTIDKLAGALGHKATMGLLQKIGATLKEDSFVTPGSPQGFGSALTPGQAKAQIQTLMADRDFSSKYMQGNSEARAKMESLHQYAYPEG